ncbi:MAG: type II secretion system F family protein [Planctomycetota bacterium]
MSLLRFEYLAVSAGGERLTGAIEAPSEHEAFRLVSAKGLTPVRIKEHVERPPLFSWGQIKPADIANLTRELAVLVHAKIPLARGLLSIAEHEGKPALKKMVRQIAISIEAGSPITDALSQHKAVFGEVYIETIRAAERSGNLPLVISHLAELLERQMEMKQQLKRALTYPVIVLGVVALAMVIIFVFVVPRFAKTFEQQGVKLPLVTQVVQGIGLSVQHYWFLYVGVIAAGIITITAMWRSATGRPMLELFCTRIPYVGRILLAETAARFSRVMAIGMSSGLDVIDAIEVSGRASGKHAFREETKTMADRLRGGAQLSEVLKSSRFIPNFARRMLAAGKDATELAKACDVVGSHYDREASHLMKNINTVVEPLLTVALAAIVLVVALSVFIPMWEMVRINK